MSILIWFSLDQIYKMLLLFNRFVKFIKPTYNQQQKMIAQRSIIRNVHLGSMICGTYQSNIPHIILSHCIISY